MTTVIEAGPTTALAHRTGAALQATSFSDAVRFAELMCKASLVPQHLQGKAADCLLVIEQAQRWGLSPFAVAQCTSVIQGKLMFEGKLVAAVINARGELARRLNYEYTGEGNARRCRVHGVLRGEDVEREVVVELGKVRTRNSQWDSQPDQQLAYHGARVWARRHMPELMLGVYSPEEFDAAPKDLSPHAESASAGESVAASSTARRGVMALADETLGEEVDVADDGEYTEDVPIYDPSTGEQIGAAPKLTSAQNAKIHALMGECGHHLDEFKRGKGSEKGEIVKLGKYRKKLREFFSKEHTNELTVQEASRVIEWLMRVAAKLRQATGEPAPPELQP